VTGSGKTVLASRISAVTGVPWYPVDELTWEPGWIEVPLDEQERRIVRICAGDGNSKRYATRSHRTRSCAGTSAPSRASGSGSVTGSAGHKSIRRFRG
jgi:hypothetical protein